MVWWRDQIIEIFRNFGECLDIHSLGIGDLIENAPSIVWELM